MSSMLDLESFDGRQWQALSQRIRRLDGRLLSHGSHFDVVVARARATLSGYAIAFLPIIPSALAMWAFMRMFHGLDELQRRIQLEAVAFSFLATCLITLTWAFQQNAGLPRFDVAWVAPLLIMLWSVGLAIAKRRYE